MLSVGHIQALDQLHYQAQLPEQNLANISVMDDLMEMIGLSSWSDTNAMNKFPWDQNTHNNIIESSNTSNGGNTNSDLLSQSFPFNPTDQKMNYNHNLSSNDIASETAQQQQAVQATSDGLFSLPYGPQNVLPRMQEGLQYCRLPPMSEISKHVLRPPFPDAAQAWQHIFMSSASSSSSPLGFGHFSASANQSINARIRPSSNESQVGPNGMFIPQPCGPQLRPPALPLMQVQQQNIQIPNGVSGSPYPASTHTGLGQPQGAAAVVAGTARPRVRARRGQATDPHSIAERLRRERIAERMKALQELVPNANKTDKASMLDEIIEYVRFLQLQVKVLSMSRISGSGAIAPMVADVISSEVSLNFNNASNSLQGPGAPLTPSQDNMAVAERQVAKLMEESMGSAMQFLQSKGLCLMPISLASTMSSNSNGGIKTSTSSSQNDLVVWPQVNLPTTSTRLSSNAPLTMTMATSTTMMTSSSILANATTTISTMAMRPTNFGDVVIDQANSSIMTPIQTSTIESLSATNSTHETNKPI